MRYFRLKEDVKEQFSSGYTQVVQSRFTVIEAMGEPTSPKYKEISRDQMYICEVLQETKERIKTLTCENTPYFDKVVEEYNKLFKGLEKLV